MNGEFKVSRMMASGQDPFVGVHALTEFIYCPRAGILAFELEREQGPEEQANLSSLPRWSLVRIERRLQSLIRQLELFVAIAVAVSIFLVVYHHNMPAIVGCGLALVAIASGVMRCVRGVKVLYRRRRQALQAEAHEPTVDHVEPQSVNWWSLLKAGFESIAYKDALRDEQWKLLGRPWRVLRKGSLRIPVFVTRDCPTLRRQHFTRMAAYCHLLTRCEGADSPYGVVIERDTYRGWTVPYTPASRKAFHDGLVTARTTIRQARMGVEPVSPVNRSVCRGCPLGKPYVHRRGKTETNQRWQPIRVNGRRGVDGRLYHSLCGDRFGWTPPHEKAFRKGLL